MARKTDDDWRPGPDIERAYCFDAAFCADPECGLHIVPKRKDGSAICEIVMTARQTLTVIEVCQNHLYDKATRNGDS
jgi:hypothetical protein